MRRRDEEGFTLVELMVVVLIIAVLLGIAIPTFLGARKSANDRVTASNVRTAFTAARIYYNERQLYTDDPDELRDLEPSITWTNAPLTGVESTGTVYVEVQDVPSSRQTVVVVGRSKAGRCFFLRDVMAGAATGTHYQAVVPAGAACTVPGPADPGWADTWPS